MILSLLFAFTADACCAKKSAAYYAKHGKHCCEGCKTRASHNKKQHLRPTKKHVVISNHITRAITGVKRHHAGKHRTSRNKR